MRTIASECKCYKGMNTGAYTQAPKHIRECWVRCKDASPNEFDPANSRIEQNYAKLLAKRGA